jgi:hypothetical protein
MKQLRLIVLTAAALVVAAVVLLMIINRPGPAEPEPATPSAAPVTPGPAIGPTTPAPQPATVWLPPLPAPVTDAPVAPERIELESMEGAPPIPAVRIAVGQILATVNLLPITAADLVAVPPGQAEIELAADEYEARLERAIDMSLVYQAARAQGVGLDAAQQRRLQEVWEHHAATMRQYRQEGITWTTVTAEMLDFESRLLAGKMLQQNLVRQATGLAPSPDPAKQAAYEEALRQLLDQLRQAANITQPAGHEQSRNL